MKKRVETGQGSAIKRAAESVRNFKQSGSTTSNTIIEFALAEAVKDHLRESARKGVVTSSGRTFLNNAIAEVGLGLKEELGYIFDTTRYFDRIKKKLSFPSKFISERLEDYDRFKGDAEIAPSREEVLESGVAIEIVHVGFHDAIEGLFLSPCSPWEDLRIEDLSDEYRIDGDNFPFEIWLDSMNYVLDYDGTIFVSTEHLPQRQVPEIEERLINLAEHLYSK